MNKIFSFTIIFLCLSFVSNAQYTRVINSNLPGNTQTPYTVGTNVFQFENALTYSNLSFEPVQNNAFQNNFRFRYGFWKEKLEGFLQHKISHNNISNLNENILGTEQLSIGFKYLVLHYVPKENEDVKKSWKKRYSFWRNGLIPDVGVSIQYNAPLNDKRFDDLNNGFFRNNGHSASASVTTSNQISRKITINNQFEYNYIGSNLPEFIYSLSGKYALSQRLKPYAEFRFQNRFPENIDNFNYFTGLVGIPFAITTDFIVAANYGYNFGKDVGGSEVGINVSYRINKHVDKWKDIKYKYVEEVVYDGVAVETPTTSVSAPVTPVDVNYAEEGEGLSLDPEIRKKQRLKAEKDKLRAEERAAKDAEKAKKKAEKAARKAQKEAEREAEKAKKRAEREAKKAAKNGEDTKVNNALLDY